LSPRAACRLETLGFEQVYDYVPGKVDWLARMLPVEGARANETRVGDLARDDVVTCGLGDDAVEVGNRIEESPYGFALVEAEDGTLLGRLRRSAIEAGKTAEEVMSPGPSTVRPDADVDELRGKLDAKDLKTAIVSTPEGRLIGVVLRKALDE
jgi:CBS domain-containing protein